MEKKMNKHQAPNPKGRKPQGKNLEFGTWNLWFGTFFYKIINVL